MIKILKNIVLIFLFLFTSSCSHTIYYYNQCFGIKNKKQFTFYRNGGGDYYPDNDEGWKELEEKTRKGEEFKPFEYAPDSEVIFEYFCTPKYYVFNYKSKSDTLFIIKDSLQEVSFFPISGGLLPRRILSRGTDSFSALNTFFVEYIKDSVVLFLDYPPQLIDIFHFYPKYYHSDTYPNPILIENQELHTPLIIGFLKVHGVPIYLEGYNYMIKDYDNLLKCYQIQEVKFVSKRKIKEILY